MQRVKKTLQMKLFVCVYIYINQLVRSIKPFGSGRLLVNFYFIFFLGVEESR